MMTRQRFEKDFDELCTKHRIKLFLNDPKVEDDNGYAQYDEVHLGRKYKSLHIYMAVAFHEFSHAVINIKRSNKVKQYKINSCFMEEWFAWSLAMRYYGKYTGKPFTKQMGDFVLGCLKTHSASHYSFKDIFGDKMKEKVAKRHQTLEKSDAN